MASDETLLPPASTRLERSFASLAARVTGIGYPVEVLWDPANCPIDLLPWLAWAVSIDRWDGEWSAAEKRAAVAGAIAEQQRKGSRLSVEAAAASFDELITIIEWFEAVPVRAPYTFEVNLPVVDADGVAGGKRVSAATARAIVREISRVKPERAHFELVMQLDMLITGAPIAAAQATHYRRLEMIRDDAAGTPWTYLITDENGEPLTDDTGEMIDGSAP